MPRLCLETVGLYTFTLSSSDPGLYMCVGVCACMRVCVFECVNFVSFPHLLFPHVLQDFYISSTSASLLPTSCTFYPLVCGTHFKQIVTLVSAENFLPSLCNNIPFVKTVHLWDESTPDHLKSGWSHARLTILTTLTDLRLIPGNRLTAAVVAGCDSSTWTRGSFFCSLNKT